MPFVATLGILRRRQQRNAVSTIVSTATDTATPMPIVTPNDMLFDAELVDGVREMVGAGVVVGEVSVEVGEATAETGDGAAIVDSGPAVNDPNNFKTSLSVDCHLTWITSAKIVF